MCRAAASAVSLLDAQRVKESWAGTGLESQTNGGREERITTRSLNQEAQGHTPSTG